jgi:hypothetical protein
MNVPDEGYPRNMNVPDEGYPRNMSCALNLISTFLLQLIFSMKPTFYQIWLLLNLISTFLLQLRFSMKPTFYQIHMYGFYSI